MSGLPEHTRQVRVTNKLGLHARAATKLVQLAARFKCDVFLERDGERVNGKSIMGVLMLTAAIGTTLTVITTGPDAAEALEAICALFASRFGED